MYKIQAQVYWVLEEKRDAMDIRVGSQQDVDYTIPCVFIRGLNSDCWSAWLNLALVASLCHLEIISAFSD